MFQQTFITPIRSINCFIHKKQKATHICTDLQCINNPILCTICLSDPKFRNPHLNHENSIKSVHQAIQILANCIKNQIKPNQSIYQKTIGHKGNQIIKNNLDKMQFLTQQIQTRINNIKMQIDIELQILTKQFQRLILLEKQQFIKKLDDYKKIFITNLDILKRQTNEIITFENSLKFYSNPNTLLLKLSTQAQKKSLDWLMQQKKILFKISKNQNSYVLSSSYNNLQSYITKANEMNMMLKPIWNGQKKQVQSQKDLKLWIKNNIQGWALIPQLKDLSKSTSPQQNSTSMSSQQYRSSPYSPMYPYSNSYLTNIN